jgi:hypothetical protein
MKSVMSCIRYGKTTNDTCYGFVTVNVFDANPLIEHVKFIVIIENNVIFFFGINVIPCGKTFPLTPNLRPCDLYIEFELLLEISTIPSQSEKILACALTRFVDRTVT